MTKILVPVDSTPVASAVLASSSTGCSAPLRAGW